MRFARNLGLVRGKVASRIGFSHQREKSSIPAASTNFRSTIRRRSASRPGASCDCVAVASACRASFGMSAESR